MNLYRYDDPMDEDSRIRLTEYQVMRETPRGYWVRRYQGFGKLTERWTSNCSKTRLAHPTKKEALFAYIKRKEYQIPLLEGRLERAIENLRKARNMYLLEKE